VNTEAAVQPDPRLNIHRSLWLDLTCELHRRTEGRHESGAFLLGHKSQDGRRVSALVYYDELDAEAYSSGVCILPCRCVWPTWQRLRDLGLVVVADAHVHGLDAGQSRADRESPMVARAGHLAIILPLWRGHQSSVAAVGLYEYLGDHQWRAHDACQHGGVLNIQDDK